MKNSQIEIPKPAPGRTLGGWEEQIRLNCSDTEFERADIRANPRCMRKRGVLENGNTGRAQETGNDNNMVPWLRSSLNCVLGEPKLYFYVKYHN